MAYSRSYYRQPDAASRSGGDVLPFIRYAVQGFVDGLRAQLAHIREQQWDVTWENFVHETFKDKNSKADARRKHLVLDLSDKSEPVPISKLTEISPRIAAAYAGRTRRMLMRDLNVLHKMDLICFSKTGFRAKKEAILAFLPIQAKEKDKSCEYEEAPLPTLGAPAPQTA